MREEREREGWQSERIIAAERDIATGDAFSASFRLSESHSSRLIREVEVGGAQAALHPPPCKQVARRSAYDSHQPTGLSKRTWNERPTLQFP